jgi:hypothetical protein
VQLRTIRAYTGDLPPQMRDAIRARFAARVFGAEPLASPNGASPSVIGELSELLTAAARLATAPGSRNGVKEK